MVRIASIPHHRLMVAAFLVGAGLAGCSDEDREARLRSAGPNPTLGKLLAIADADVGRRKFGQCAACHTISPGGLNRVGPNLHGVVGKPIAGASPSYGYSYALKSISGTWDAKRMDSWLADPRAFAPGTTMTFPGLRDPLDRADVIAYLKAQSD